MQQDIIKIIENAYNEISNMSYPSQEVVNAVNTIINTLDCGGIRIAENIGNEWITHQWIKKAILLSFKINKNKVINSQYAKFFDKIELKFADYTHEQFEHDGIRVVPDAVVRKGAFIGKNSVLMPCYVNIGAHVGENVMVDTWATVGSCAQIGNNVHLSGGVGIGGVLEPLQSNPTIIEDDCFIGARSEVVEGVVVKQGSVISMGVYLSQSTKIYDRRTKTISYGIIPPYSVVIPGSLPSADGTHSTYAAIIMKQVDQKTRAKVSINDILRN